MIELIREVGFVPAQRTTLYEILKVYEKAEAQIARLQVEENAPVNLGDENLDCNSL